MCVLFLNLRHNFCGNPVWTYGRREFSTKRRLERVNFLRKTGKGRWQGQSHARFYSTRASIFSALRINVRVSMRRRTLSVEKTSQNVSHTLYCSLWHMYRASYCFRSHDKNVFYSYIRHGHWSFIVCTYVTFDVIQVLLSRHAYRVFDTVLQAAVIATGSECSCRKNQQKCIYDPKRR